MSEATRELLNTQATPIMHRRQLLYTVIMYLRQLHCNLNLHTLLEKLGDEGLCVEHFC